MPRLGHIYCMRNDGELVHIPEIIDVVAWQLTPNRGPDDKRTKAYRYVQKYVYASTDLQVKMIRAAEHAIDIEKALIFGSST